jgi:hypothetical protein
MPKRKKRKKGYKSPKRNYYYKNPVIRYKKRDYQWVGWLMIKGRVKAGMKEQ